MARGEPGCYLTQRELDAVCPKLSGSEWKVYTALATCRNAKTGETPPVGISLVMEKTGLQKSTAFHAISNLEKTGFVEKTTCGNRSRYRFLLS